MDCRGCASEPTHVIADIARNRRNRKKQSSPRRHGDTENSGAENLVIGGDRSRVEQSITDANA